MLRLLSWTGCDKANSPDLSSIVTKPDSLGSKNLTMPPTHKRKHSVEQQSQSERKRARTVEHQKRASPDAPTPAPLQQKTSPSTPGTPPLYLPSSPAVQKHESVSEPPETVLESAQDSRLGSIRNVIQTQIGLEILIKHKELRLIDQEIAKCQASLEQLRRCQEIPYPGTQSLSAAVSNGVGPALRTKFSATLPPSPAPWGVQDGPYTRHYAKWLLQDPHFDGGEPEVMVTPVGKSPMQFRSQSRATLPETPSMPSHSRAQRGGKLKSLPAGYGQPKEKATGPMILKRKSDGASVKLVCPDCGRSDFGSAQGFINHCRIGHGRSFASHDAAAEACGEVIEVDATGAMIRVEPVATPTTGNVHPLIRSAKLIQPIPPRTAASKSSRGGNATPVTPKHVSPDFRGSNLAPNLSELIQGRGLGLDLQGLITDAKTKVDLPDSDSEDDAMDNKVPTVLTAQGRHPQVAGTKQPAKSSMSPSLLSSTMLDSPTNLRGGESHRFAKTTSTPGSHRLREMMLPLTDNSMTDVRPLDPSPTSESNQAPSLVDDDEEFEPHSPSSSSMSDEHDLGEIDFAIQDDDDDARNVLREPEYQPSCAQAARPQHARRPSAIRRHGEDREEKHVSFVSPSPAREVAQVRDRGDRKTNKV